MAYSLIRHIALSILFGGFSERTPIAMFTAYFDASGTKRGNLLTVAGFVSHLKRWERFERKWSDILEREKIPSFHMTDFASGQGAFKAWDGRNNSERRRQLISDLVECIRKETKRGFASTVVVGEFEEVDKSHKLQEFVGAPYALCAHACLVGLDKWGAKRGINRKQVLIAVEEGDQDQGTFLERARLDGHNAVAFPKTYARAFEAADMVGWKSRTTINNALTKDISTEKVARDILRSLDPIRGIVQNNGVYDKGSLLALCDKTGIPLRAHKQA